MYKAARNKQPNRSETTVFFQRFKVQYIINKPLLKQRRARGFDLIVGANNHTKNEIQFTSDVTWIIRL